MNRHNLELYHAETNNVNGEHLKFTATMQLATAQENGMFNVVSKAAYGCTIDPDSAAAAWSEKEKEFETSGLTPKPSVIINPPIVKEAKVNFECKLNQIVQIGDEEPGGGFIVIGTIIMFHIDDKIYEDGKLNLEKLRPIGRLSGNSYIRSTDQFDIIRKIKPK